MEWYLESNEPFNKELVASKCFSCEQEYARARCVYENGLAYCRRCNKARSLEEVTWELHKQMIWIQVLPGTVEMNTFPEWLSP